MQGGSGVGFLLNDCSDEALRRVREISVECDPSDLYEGVHKGRRVAYILFRGLLALVPTPSNVASLPRACKHSFIQVLFLLVQIRKSYNQSNLVFLNRVPPNAGIR